MERWSLVTITTLLALIVRWAVSLGSYSGRLYSESFKKYVEIECQLGSFIRIVRIPEKETYFKNARHKNSLIWNHEYRFPYVLNRIANFNINDHSKEQFYVKSNF